MRNFRRIGLVLLCLAAMLLIYYSSYRIYMNRIGSKEKESYESQYVERSVTVNQSKENRITNRTELIIESYNRKSGIRTDEKKNMPAQYIGLLREELVDYLLEYQKKPSIDDIQEGFEKYQVVSFSEEQIVIRKIYYPPNVAYKYYLVAENGCVTVYYIDKQTVFEYTNIVVDTLPSEIKSQIEKGKYIVDIDSLYDFLESYSS